MTKLDIYGFRGNEKMRLIHINHMEPVPKSETDAKMRFVDGRTMFVRETVDEMIEKHTEGRGSPHEDKVQLRKQQFIEFISSEGVEGYEESYIEGLERNDSQSLRGL